MNNDDNNRDENEEPLDPGPGDSWPARDSLFRDLEESEEFEESDRDSDYASVFTEVEEEEPDFPDEETGSQLDSPDAAADPEPWEEEEYDPAEPEPAAPAEEETWAALSSLAADQRDIEPGPDDLEPEEAWEDEAYEEEQRETTLPLGLIAVGIIALVLLGAGGYGVMQDRAALQEEIRQLQASLATTASPAEVAETRAASESLVSHNRELEQQVADLSRENRSLQAIVGGLESQLQAQQEALSKAKAPAPKPAPRKPESKPAPKAASAAAGTWFVNFGSYSQRITAEGWAQRLKPGTGDVIVSTGEKDGRTFYRVRVVKLPSEDAANATARQLEQDYGLSRLWVGRAR